MFIIYNVYSIKLLLQSSIAFKNQRDFWLQRDKNRGKNFETLDSILTMPCTPRGKSHGWKHFIESMPITVEFSHSLEEQYKQTLKQKIKLQNVETKLKYLPEILVQQMTL